MSKRYIYGPVPSRRLGRSLGIDIIPHKICSYDCIYCQLGNTMDKTINRKTFYKPSLILDELNEFLEQNIEVDFITFSGSGEPTLNSDIGEMISQVKFISDIPTVVLTNGSLLWDENVRYELKEADIVVPSMDAVSGEVFEMINRPCKELEILKVLDGLRKFSESFQGKIYLEMMFVKGINDSEYEINKMREFIQKLRIDKIQLNTVVRPPCEKDSKPLNKEEMGNIKEMFRDSGSVETIAHFSAKIKTVYNIDVEKEVINLLKRRPCKLKEMSVSLGIHTNELIKYMTELESKNIIKSYVVDDSKDNYYKVF